MPKLRHDQWPAHADPDSEEYAPTDQEIKDNDATRGTILYELSDIERELQNPGEDPYTGEQSKYQVWNPEDLWERLAYLRADHLENMKDPEIKAELEKKISEIEKRVYKQYVPYIDAEIYIFGYNNSPYSRHKRGGVIAEDRRILMMTARSIAEDLKLPKDELVGFNADLDRLNEKLEQYESEPRLFTFEEEEGALYREIFAHDDRKFWRSIDPSKRIEDPAARARNLEEFDELIKKANVLIGIAGEMTDQEIQKGCQNRAECLVRRTQQMKDEFESPREVLILESKLKDLLRRAKDKEEIEESRLDELESELETLSTKQLGGDHRKNIERLTARLEIIRKILSGEAVDEDDARFDMDLGSLEGALNLLDVTMSTEKDDVIAAYYRLAKKYHPDINKNEEAEEKMKELNNAYDLISRVRGFNKPSVE